MATTIAVNCDRCGKEAVGWHYPATEGSMEMTAGYYDVTGLPWSKYANEGEQAVCDACMWKDERYLADYPMAKNNPE